MILLIVTRPGVRTKIIEVYRMYLYNIYVYQRGIQYIEVENNFYGVSNREELRFYPLKSRKDYPSLVLCSLVFFVVSICFFYYIYVLFTLLIEVTILTRLN